MGKDLKGKELGEGIYQQANGTYCARFVEINLVANALKVL